MFSSLMLIAGMKKIDIKTRYSKTRNFEENSQSPLFYSPGIQSYKFHKRMKHDPVQSQTACLRRLVLLFLTLGDNDPFSPSLNISTHYITVIPPLWTPKTFKFRCEVWSRVICLRFWHIVQEKREYLSQIMASVPKLLHSEII